MSTTPDEPAPPVVIHRGGVYWVRPAPGVAEYAHPHVVLQDEVFNRSRLDTVIVCALTTNPHRGREPGNVVLDPGEAGLPQSSVVVVSQLLTLSKTQLGKYIGTLSPERVDQILDGLRFQQQAFFRGR